MLSCRMLTVTDIREKKGGRGGGGEGGRSYRFVDIDCPACR